MLKALVIKELRESAGVISLGCVRLVDDGLRLDSLDCVATVIYRCVLVRHTSGTLVRDAAHSARCRNWRGARGELYAVVLGGACDVGHWVGIWAPEHFLLRAR